MEKMKTNFYTNLILTIIAGCLLCIVFRDVNIPTTARAEISPGDTLDVNIVQINGRSITPDYAGNFDASLPVTPTKGNK